MSHSLTMRHSIPALFAAIALFASCSSSDGGGQGTAVPALPTNASTSSAAPSSSSGTAMLNPPHGEPGHVCEIPVGEPLDGSGSNAVDPNHALNASPAVTPTMTTITPGGGGSGRINPPHGEPGHDCAVPVGEPLP
jgi:hypothetical protein